MRHRARASPPTRSTTAGEGSGSPVSPSLRASRSSASTSHEGCEAKQSVPPRRSQVASAAPAAATST